MLIAIVGAILLALTLAFALLHRHNPLAAVREDGQLYFPRITGENLLRQPVRFPEDIRGRPTLVLVAFFREQQIDVNTWLDEQAALEARLPGLRLIETPTISSGRWGLAADFIDGAMRSGIPDPAARERTITFYTDVDAFCRALDLPTTGTIYAVLLDERTRVLAVEPGPFTQAALDRLAGALPAPEGGN